MVSATAAICDAIERRVFKPEHRTAKWRPPALTARSRCSRTRTARARTGRVQGRPTDGIVPIKQLYFVALHWEPGIPIGKGVEHNGCQDRETSPFSDGTPSFPPGNMPVEGIETPWRELVGGALVSTGSLLLSQGF